MDKYKVIAEKITYSLDGYINDHNNRNFGDADGWLRHVRRGWGEFIEAHPDCLNLHEYLQHQQAKVAETIDEMYVKEVQKSDELQKRVEWLEDRLKATDTLSKMRAAVIGSFNSKEFNARTRRKMMILKRAEQALKGEGQ